MLPLLTRAAGKLKPLDIERETRPGKYPDGEGLYLIVASATSKNWNYSGKTASSAGSASARSRTSR